MPLPARSRATRAALTIAALVVAGCEGPAPTPLAPRFDASAASTGGTFTVCKVGTAATFDVTENGVSTGTVSLASGECRQVADANPVAIVAGVSEQSSSGIVIDSITVDITWLSGPPIHQVLTGVSSFSGAIGDQSIRVTFFNKVVGLGRMTGGGGQITIGDVYVSRGFTIHCDIVLSNNIEVNWPDNKFHITRPLTSALCIDDPTISPVPPAAPFDTFIGVAEGEHNGVPGATLRFTFVDDGERGGDHDMASLHITDANGNVVLNVPLSFLDRGNIQAHYDQPHGNKP